MLRADAKATVPGVPAHAIPSSSLNPAEVPKALVRSSQPETRSQPCGKAEGNCSGSAGRRGDLRPLYSAGKQ